MQHLWPPRIGKVGLVLVCAGVLTLAGGGILAANVLLFVNTVSTAGLQNNVTSVVVQSTTAEPTATPVEVAAPQTSPIVIPPTPVAPRPARVNILLLGYGGPGHDGPYLTDSL